MLKLSPDLFDSVCEFLPNHQRVKTCCRELNALEHSKRAWAHKTVDTHDPRVFDAPVDNVVFRGEMMHVPQHDALKRLRAVGEVKGEAPEGLEELVLDCKIATNTTLHIPDSVTRISWTRSNLVLRQRLRNLGSILIDRTRIHECVPQLSVHTMVITETKDLLGLMRYLPNLRRFVMFEGTIMDELEGLPLTHLCLPHTWFDARQLRFPNLKVLGCYNLNNGQLLTSVETLFLWRPICNVELDELPPNLRTLHVVGQGDVVTHPGIEIVVHASFPRHLWRFGFRPLSLFINSC